MFDLDKYDEIKMREHYVLFTFPALYQKYNKSAVGQCFMK